MTPRQMRDTFNPVDPRLVYTMVLPIVGHAMLSKLKSMDYAWSEYEGRTIDRYTLDTFLGVRDGTAFYVTARDAEPALLQIVPGDSPIAAIQLAAWHRAQQLSHENLMRV